MKRDLLSELREGRTLNSRDQILLILSLSTPAILSEISTIVMEYIDASMVGQLGAKGSAAIGLVASSTWLFGSVGHAAVIGNTVQVAQSIGARREDRARQQMKQAFIVVMTVALLLCAAAVGISGGLPRWLGGAADICPEASAYFLIYGLAIPGSLMATLASGMLQASGNMKTPSIMNVLMCALDVVFNFFLIFSGRTIFGIPVPGAGLGVMGAALGTALAHWVVAGLQLYLLLARSPSLGLRKGEPFRFDWESLKRCAAIGVPLGFQQFISTGAQVMSTRIVAPLGTIAVAANSLAVTVESLCYMPGYGIGSAASTLIGQSVGAERKDLTRKLGALTTGLGISVMTLSGLLMYALAPFMMGTLTPDPQVVSLGARVLRIEAFAEPMFAASIVAAGVFRGAGDTLVPSVFNMVSMWLVRIPAAAYLAPRFGLTGVWIAMCVELNVRGILFLIRLAGKRWMKTSTAGK